MQTVPQKIGTLTLKNGKNIEVYHSCCLDGYCFYYQNEVFLWKSCPISEIRDFGQLLYAGNLPAAI
jgi:hypothetical protein